MVSFINPLQCDVVINISKPLTMTSPLSLSKEELEIPAQEELEEIKQELYTESTSNLWGLSTDGDKVLLDYAVEHISSLPGHPCPICHRMFNKTGNLNRHLGSKHGLQKPFACHICSKGFSEKYGLQNHLLKTHGVENVAKFPCNFCEKGFSSQSALDLHTRGHENEVKVEPDEELVPGLCCAYCSLEFESQPELDSHIEINHTKGGFICPQCGKAYVQKSSLNRHLLIHNSSGNLWTCQVPLCGGKEFGSKQGFRLHLQQHEREAEENKPLLCCQDGCARKFAVQQSLELHLKGCHDSTKPFSCEVCEVGFNTQEKLEEHLKFHCHNGPASGGGVIFSCSYCSKSFPRKFTWERHEFAHTHGKLGVEKILSGRPSSSTLRSRTTLFRKRKRANKEEREEGAPEEKVNRLTAPRQTPQNQKKHAGNEEDKEIEDISLHRNQHQGIPISSIGANKSTNSSSGKSHSNIKTEISQEDDEKEQEYILSTIYPELQIRLEQNEERDEGAGEWNLLPLVPLPLQHTQEAEEEDTKDPLRL